MKPRSFKLYELIAEYLEKFPYKDIREIADELNIPKSTISKVFRKLIEPSEIKKEDVKNLQNVRELVSRGHFSLAAKILRFTTYPIEEHDILLKIPDRYLYYDQRIFKYMHLLRRGLISLEECDNGLKSVAALSLRRGKILWYSYANCMRMSVFFP